MTRKYTRTYTKKPPKKHIVFYSGGICSWMTAKVVIDKEGADNVLLYFTDTKTESPDLYRFLKETSIAFGAELLWDADGRDIWQVFQDERFVGNSRNDPCSKILKRRRSKRFISQFSPQDVTLYIGLDWTEEHRYIKSKEFWKPYNLLAPLCSPPHLMTREQMFRELEMVGIKRPSLYDLNFAHNNCFHRDTEVLTTDGVFKIGDLVGQQKTVIGWQRSQIPADFKSFGEQTLYKLKFKRDNISKEVLATLDHEWFARGPLGRWKRVKSQDLVAGNRLVTVSEPDWKFVGLEETGIIDEVFCAVVNDEHHAFSLTDGLLTSNCGGFCVKTGKAQFKMLLEKLPEVYAFHEQKEQEAIASGINHKGFIRHVNKGVLYYLTMKQFREMQTNLVWSAEDLLDLGGCGCFSDSEEGEV